MLIENGVDALYFDFVPGMKSWETVEEEAIFLTEEKELYGLKISLSEILEDYPKTPLDHIISRCIESGWIKEIIEGKAYLSYHFFKPEGKTKIFDWDVLVDIDKQQKIKAIEILFDGAASRIKRKKLLESQNKI